MPLAVPLYHHRHQKRYAPEDEAVAGVLNLDKLSIINLDGPTEATVTPTSAYELTASSTWFWKRSEASCAPGDDTGRCEKPTGTQALPIGLGVGIPLLLAFIGLAIVHFRHVRKVKREEANDTLDIDMDDYDPENIEDLKADPNQLEKQMSRSTVNRPYRPPNGLPSLMHEKAASIRSGLSTETRSGDPFISSTPYLLHPDINNSKTSLDEYSRSLIGIQDENKYPTSVYTTGGSIPRMPSPAHIHSPLSREPPATTTTTTTNTFSDYASAHISNTTSSTTSASVDNRSSDNHTSPMTSGSFSDSKNMYDHRGSYGSRRLSSRDSPFASKEDSDASLSDEEEEREAHSRLERKIDEGIEHVREYSRSPFSPDRDEFDFGKPKGPTFVIQDEDEDEDKPLSSGVALGRSDTTKHFDRVKSFYNEYMEEEEDEDEEEEHSKYNRDELPSRVAPQELHVPPNAASRFSEHYMATDDVPEQQARSLSPEYMPVEPLRSPGDKQTRFELEAAPREETSLVAVPNMPPSSPPEPVMPARRIPSADLARPPPPQHRAVNRSLNSSPVAAHYPPGHLPSHPDEPFIDLPRAHPSNGSDYAHSDYSGQPFPPSVSQQGRHSAQNTGVPLPKLTDLASPHNLSETDSPIAFASQRRFKTGAVTPAGSSSGASSPRFNSRGFNVLDLGEPHLTHSKSGLPSPHALRQSIVLMSAVDFAPPRKFTGIRGRSSSLSNVNGATTPNGSISGFSHAPAPSRISKYVPSAHDEDMLRPTMEMRA
ncbi:hypothetical protein TRVA0_019S00364 [Trichomonascus vanleenenianus]|uniref:Skg6p n=1 Tax=Trichomonascus vanleenenianus TaxID=2268995 RepID=UPI003ECB6524